MMDAIRRAGLDDLNALVRDVLGKWGDGLLSDADADALTTEIEKRRKALRGAAARAKANRGRGRAPQRPASVARRARLAARYHLPQDIRPEFTVAEAAAMAIIAGEIQDHGYCDRSIGELAARAGCSPTKVKHALRRARAMGLIAIEERRVDYNRHKPNIVRAIGQWETYLRPERDGGGGRKMPRTDHHRIYRGSVREEELKKATKGSVDQAHGRSGRPQRQAHAPDKAWPFQEGFLRLGSPA